MTVESSHRMPAVGVSGAAAGVRPSPAATLLRSTAPAAPDEAGAGAVQELPETAPWLVLPEASPAAGSAGGLDTGAPTLVALLADIEPSARMWGYWRFAVGRAAARKVPGVRFVKVLGSGHEGGFGLRPSISRQGLICLFDTSALAAAFVECSPLAAAYRDHAREFLSVLLHPYSSRGSWSGTRFPVTTEAPPDGPIAGLTRASIRPRQAARFWRLAAPAEASLQTVAGCRLAAGLGEAPLLRQATFTVWDSVAAMDAYARSGAHLAAIRAASDGGFFAESMFVRFVPEALRGTWKGRTYA